jgi:hypothetical protein
VLNITCHTYTWYGGYEDGEVEDYCASMSITTTSLPVANHGEFFTQTIGVTGGTAPYTFGPIEATAGEMIREFALSRPVPNPTSSSMRVDYAVPREARVDLSVFDMQGRRVTTLVEGLAHAGRNQAIWNGTAGSGPVAAGPLLKSG